MGRSGTNSTGRAQSLITTRAGSAEATCPISLSLEGTAICSTHVVFSHRGNPPQQLTRDQFRALNYEGAGSTSIHVFDLSGDQADAVCQASRRLYPPKDEVIRFATLALNHLERLSKEDVLYLQGLAHPEHPVDLSSWLKVAVELTSALEDIFAARAAKKQQIANILSVSAE